MRENKFIRFSHIMRFGNSNQFGVNIFVYSERIDYYERYLIILIA